MSAAAAAGDEFVIWGIKISGFIFLKSISLRNIQMKFQQI